MHLQFKDGDFLRFVSNQTNEQQPNCLVVGLLLFSGVYKCLVNYNLSLYLLPLTFFNNTYMHNCFFLYLMLI